MRVSEDDIDRLVKISSADPGFFIVAVHAALEKSLMQALYRDIFKRIDFNDLLYRFLKRQVYGHKPKSKIDSVKNTILKGRRITNRVRHQFAESSVQNAQAALSSFISLVKLADAYDKQLFRELEVLLDNWQTGEENEKSREEIEKLRKRIHDLKNEKQKLIGNLSRYKQLQIEKEKLENENKQLKLLIENPQFGQHSPLDSDKREQIKSRTKEIQKRKEEIDRTLEQDFPGLDNYLDDLRHISYYTGARQQYELEQMNLSQEQLGVLNEAGEKGELLIKGAAGTGKTLVLIKGMINDIEKNKDALFKEKIKPPAYFTFTHTLVQYTRYLARLSETEHDLIIQTVFDYCFKIFKKIHPDAQARPITSIGFDPPHKDTGMNKEQVGEEFETFIWANNITEDEYIKEMIERRGMKVRLSNKQRTAVWSEKTKIEQFMTEHNTYSYAFIFYAVHRHLQQMPQNEREVYSKVFVDEVQDLTAVNLMILNLVSEHGIVLAGDTDQSIYPVKLPFKRAGLDLRGKTRILKTNFRSTRQIYLLSEAYRTQQKDGFDNETAPEGYREGAAPELFIIRNNHERHKLVINKIRLFIEELDYSPADICVLSVANKDSEKLAKLLKENNYDSETDLRKTQFAESDKVHFTTMHSSKGLSYPIILLNLDYIPEWLAKQHDSETVNKIIDNLIYVSMTRAMEHFNAFIPDTEHPVMKKIEQAFEQSGF